MIYIMNVVSLLCLLMQAANICHPFGKYSLLTNHSKKKMTATSLKVIVAFPEIGPYEVLVLNQCVTCQSHPRSAREYTSDVGPKLSMGEHGGKRGKI